MCERSVSHRLTRIYTDQAYLTKENIMSPELRSAVRMFVFCGVSCVTAPSVLAQTDARSNPTESTGASSNADRRRRPRAVNPKYTTPKSPLDTAYGAKIAEYTTEKYFMTELVDHLPLSDKVPSPDKVLGYVIGTPNKLTYTKDLYRYYRELARSVAARARLHRAGEERRGTRTDAGARWRRSEPRETRSLQRDHCEARRPAKDQRRRSPDADRRRQSRSTGLRARSIRPKPARRRC